MRKTSYHMDIRRPTAAEEFRSHVIYFAVTMFFFYVVYGLLCVLFYPVRFLFMTSEKIDEEDREKAREKAEERDLRQASFRQDDSNPVNQYIKRFITDPENYEGDPENDAYWEWYEAWKAGVILDSKLRWAPDVYIRKNDKRRINAEFLDYMGNQIDLHKMGTWTQRMMFMSTIREYYPEFTPKFRYMEQDLEALRDRAAEHDIRGELKEEIESLGVPEELAYLLADSDLTAKQIKRIAGQIKACIERGFSTEATELIVRKGVKPNLSDATLINKLLKDGMPTCVAEAVATGCFSQKEMEELIETVKELSYECDSREEFDDMTRGYVNQRTAEKLSRS